MLTIFVYIHVKPEMVDGFIQATRLNVAESLKEPGVARFDFIQQADDATRFVLVEVYHTAEDPARHKATEHYSTWQQVVEAMMATPRTKIIYHEAGS